MLYILLIMSEFLASYIIFLILSHGVSDKSGSIIVAQVFYIFQFEICDMGQKAEVIYYDPVPCPMSQIHSVDEKNVTWDKLFGTLFTNNCHI